MSQHASSCSRFFDTLCDAGRRTFSADPRALGLTRVAVGAVVLAQVAVRSQGIETFYSDAGTLPRTDWARLHPHFVSLHGLSGDVRAQTALFLLHGLAALALLTGVRTRLATFVTWALTVSLAVRNPLLNDGADALLGMLLFWGNFVPWGARLSLDALRRREPVDRAPVFTVGTVGLLLQMPLVYGITVLQKHTPAWRETFDAVYYALNNDFIASRLGVLLGGAPRVLLRGLTLFTLVAELAIPFLLLAPLRSPRLRFAGVALSTTLQLGFFTCFDVGTFPFVSSAAVLPFLPALVLDGLSGRPRVATALAHLRRVAPRLLPTSPRAPSAEPTSAFGRSLTATLAALGIVAVVASNLASVGAFALRPEVTKTLAALRLGQGWMMFASPAKEAGWYVALGKLPDGRTVDLLHPGEPVSWDKPTHVSSDFPTRDLRKIYSIVRADGARPYRAAFARHLCAAPQPGGSLRAIRLYFLSRPIGGSDQEAPRKTRVLQLKCPRGESHEEAVAAR